MSNYSVDKEIADNLRGNNSANLDRLLEIKANINTCPYCNKILALVHGVKKCIQCGREFEDDFHKIKTYLDSLGSDAHIGARSISEISQATGVSTEIVELYWKRTRLETTENSPTNASCEICGAEIRSGRICFDCAKKSTARMKGYCVEEVGESVNQKTGARMHYLDKVVKERKKR